MRVKDDLAGKRIRCRSCEKPFRLPGVSDEAESYDEAEPDEEVTPGRSTKRKGTKSHGITWTQILAIGSTLVRNYLRFVLFTSLITALVVVYLLLFDTGRGTAMAAAITIGGAGTTILLLALALLIGLLSDPIFLFRMMFDYQFRWEVNLGHREYSQRMKLALGCARLALWSLLVTVVFGGLFAGGLYMARNGLAVTPVARIVPIPTQPKTVPVQQPDHLQAFNNLVAEQQKARDAEAARQPLPANPTSGTWTITVNGRKFTPEELAAASNHRAEWMLDDGTSVEVEVIEVLPGANFRVRRLGDKDAATEIVHLRKLHFRPLIDKPTPPTN